ncbi:MAG: Glutamate synthase [NADPH] large chain (EC, partial [uncultured Campylobacterales bacterium]
SEYQLRTMLELVPMMWSWPADVNCHEAEAFCKYKSEQTNQNISLPSEAQYMKIRELSEVQDEPEWEKANANINMEYFASSTPVDMFKHNDFYDVIGNVWQWTTTPISGYDGFKVHPIYDDFSVPTFDGKHNMIKGGSWSSTGNLATKQARYAFRKHFFQHAGLRYIIGKNNMKQQESNIYETDTLVSQYCAFQYGKEYFGVENFAKACARKAIKYSKNTKTALDLGCATGRASFELAQVFDEVTGIDFSARFIQVASKLADKETILYSECEQGDIITKNSCSLQSLGLETSNVKFWQGDACNLKPQFTGYDLLMATNLIDRLYKPYLFLDNVYKRVNDGGVLILTSPYTWLEEYTKKEYWIGGKVSNNKDIYAIDELKQILGKHFKLEHTEDVPFVIKETSRKYQHTISQMSVWTKI